MARVLFVCIGNAARSQMAEAFFRRFAGGRHECASAGTKPAERISESAVAAMGEKGIDISMSKPKALTYDMLAKADLVVTMGCEDACPAAKNKIDWELGDPKGKSIGEVRRIRDEIEKRVRGLLADLEKR